MSRHMATEAQMYRRHAKQQRDEAEKATLQNARARALHAAERWEMMADQLERSGAASIEREAEKAVRDAERAASR
jgi:hypothetical protein